VRVQSSETEENQKGTASHLTSVTVDGITAYGRGSSKKEAKLRAACAAVDQLRCRGLLQQRIIEKEVSANPVTQENAVTKLKRLYGARNYNFINSGTTADFTACVTVNDSNYTGSGRSKKLARLAAAEHALRELNMLSAEDEAANKQAPAAELVASQMSPSSVNVDNFYAVRSRGIPVYHDRGLGSGQSGRGRGRGANKGRGLLQAGQMHDFPSTSCAESGRGRGEGSRGKLRGSETAGGQLARRAAATAAEHMEMLTEKFGPVNILNEVYQSTEVYNYQSTVGDQTDEATVSEGLCTCTVSVDGVTGYGTGTTTKAAKRNAASSAVEQLKAAGILQKRLADK